MLNVLSSELFEQSANNFNSQSLNKKLHELQNQTQQIEKHISRYEQKINTLPLQLRNQIKLKQSILTNEKVEVMTKKQKQQDQEQNEVLKSFNKRTLVQKLRQLQQQQAQILYLNGINQSYLSCQIQNGSSQNILSCNKIDSELNQIECLSKFISTIKFYEEKPQNFIINDIIKKTKNQTAKKLIEKCQNLIHYGVGQKNKDKIVIQKYLLQNCKNIILNQDISKEITKQKESKQTKNQQILRKFVSKILNQVIIYEVRYQKVLLMQIAAHSQQNEQEENKHQQIIQRKKTYFNQQESPKYFQRIQYTLKKHIQVVENLKDILWDHDRSSLSDDLKEYFEKCIDKQISELKGSLQYILPYLNLKSRKDLISILSHGKKNEVIAFQDLILRLKFKGQDGDMFMNNLDSVFSRIIQIKIKGQVRTISFNFDNFQTLINFFELGIFQAHQSLFETSTKAFNKLTTNFKMGSARKNSGLISANSKKLFNMIFFSVSTLIQKLDSFMEVQQDILFKERDQQILQEWNQKLLQIRQNVRKKIYSE